MARTRPAIFVGSSGEGLGIAQAVQVLLDPHAEVELWTQGVFGLSQGTLESLVLALQRFDFAVLVLTADDLLIKRGVTAPAARDNVLFELGLFVGGLGRDRTFMIYNRAQRPDLPTDLAGITAATFEPHSSGNAVAALGAACYQIQERVSKLGLRDSERFQRLSEAANNVEDVGSQMQQLIKLLARSRKVELDVISTQFGPVIDPQRLAEMQKDLSDLEQILEAGSNRISADDYFPHIEAVSDSLGNEASNTVYAQTILAAKPVRVGEQVEIQVLSTDPLGGEVEFSIARIGIKEWTRSNARVISFVESDIGRTCDINVMVRSQRAQHAYRDFDDYVMYRYVVLPRE